MIFNNAFACRQHFNVVVQCGPDFTNDCIVLSVMVDPILQAENVFCM